jgi:DNA primase
LNRGFDKQFLVKNKVGYDTNTYSVTIPIFFSGDYYGVIRRTILEDHQPKYKYPEHMPKRSLLYMPLYVENPTNKKLLIVEGSLDALKCAQNGYYSVATLGCMPTQEQINIISDYCRQNGLESILLYDNDQAGIDGSKYAIKQGYNGKIASIDKLAEVWYAEGTEVKKDPGELTKDELDFLVKNSVSSLRYKLEKLNDNGTL